MDMASFPNLFQTAIKSTINEAIEKIVTEEAKEASARVEKRVRGALPLVAMSVFDNWTATWENKTTLAIRVDFKEPK